MRIEILPIGKIEVEVNAVSEKISEIFPKSTSTILSPPLTPPEEAYNPERRQYRAPRILQTIQEYGEGKTVHRILGATDVDLYVPNLNFVFGQAECPGRTALISLCRLKPQFYGHPSNPSLLKERTVKEAVHELGHTLGLRHCPHPSCVMHFSNSIRETDKKEPLFCTSCHNKVRKVVNTLER